jgi:acetyl esterase/lipase
VSAVRWLAANPDTVGAQDGQLVLMGDSAGGNLVAATTHCLSQDGGPGIDRQILLYPCLAPARTSEFTSYETYADGPLMSRAEMAWFWDHYLRSQADELDPRAAPLLVSDLSGSPRTTLVLAELDPLRDEGLAYGERLRQQGVATEITVYRGAAHGFWWMDGEMRQAAELTDQLGRRLRADYQR